MLDLNELNLIVKDNVIENLNEVLEIIENAELDFNTHEYLETLLNKLKYADIHNKQKLISLISEKILEYKNKEQENISDDIFLQDIQEYNDDFKEIGIIETKENNVEELEVNEVLENQFDDKKFDLERFKEIIIKRNIYDIKPTYEEMAYITSGVSYLLNTMISRAENNNLESEEQLALEDYIHPLVNTYFNLPDELSDTDKLFVEKYISVKSEIKEKGLSYKTYVPELKPDKNNNQNGIANIVMVLEIIILGMMIITFLSLDI